MIKKDDVLYIGKILMEKDRVYQAWIKSGRPIVLGRRSPPPRRPPFTAACPDCEYGWDNLP